jgi:hypothetical protein
MGGEGLGTADPLLVTTQRAFPCWLTHPGIGLGRQFHPIIRGCRLPAFPHLSVPDFVPSQSADKLARRTREREARGGGPPRGARRVSG